VNWGKLWVEYDVDLYVPQLPPGGASLSLSQHLTSSSSTTASILAGTVTTLATSSPLVSVALDVVTFLVPGSYIVTLS